MRANPVGLLPTGFFYVTYVQLLYQSTQGTEMRMCATAFVSEYA
jgi:hypothetical protein